MNSDDLQRLAPLNQALMAAWGGSLTDAQIRDVIAFIRTLADPPYSPPAD